MQRFLIASLALAFFCSIAAAQTWDREKVNFADIERMAKDLASKPYVPTDKYDVPKWIRSLTPEQYRDIRFKPEAALWKAENLPFQVMLFHPGNQSHEPVQLSEFTDTHKQEIRLSEDFFTYGPSVPNHSDMRSDLGFGGFRIHAPLNRPDYFDELITFEGPCNWRALGKNQRYGTSAWALAIDTGVESQPEEFPRFREFWLHKPKQGQTSALLYALLDSPSYAGAYGFLVQPGEETVVQVWAVIYPRKQVKRLGLAPMRSMYLFGENSRRCFDDFHPEVHSSDGLAMKIGTGECLWRPLNNDSGKTEFSFFSTEKPIGFGLLQRDKRFDAYEDAEANYQLRPSVWIEPTSNWGSGQIMLMENPLDKEGSDNVTVLWEPGKSFVPGERFEFSYKQHWTMNPDPAGAGGRVISTRTAAQQPDKRSILVEFAGGALENWQGDAPTAVVQAVGPGSEKVRIVSTSVDPLTGGHWRAHFQIAPSQDGGKLSDIGPVELRCCLKRGEDFLTETWVYRITP